MRYTPLPPAPHVDRRQWHRKFVIWPRKLRNGQKAFLETVMCKGKYFHAGYASGGYWEWEYVGIEDILGVPRD